MKKNNNKNTIIKFFVNYWIFSLFVLLLMTHVFTRFSNLESKNGFGWDQLDNAWVAKNIIVDHKLPITGMQARGNTGFYIGPYYYYLIVPFYFLTNLDPVASGIIAGVTSLFTFFLLFFLLKDIFDGKVAIIALFINTFSFLVINSDRGQWPVDLIAPISLLIYYSLYKIINGNSKYILLLVFAFGFSLHIHFTSILYIPIILFSLPFFPRRRETFLYLLYSLPIFIFFIFPIVIVSLIQGNSRALSYVGSSFLGIHLTRFMQVLNDGFIQFEEVINVNLLKRLGFLLFPLYIFLLIYENPKRKSITLAYLSILWIIIPWFAFSTYRGEISDYYFSMTRIIVFIVLGYLLAKLLNFKKKSGLALIIVVLSLYAGFNYMQFSSMADDKNSLVINKMKIREKIKNGEIVSFNQGDPQSYLYFIYKQRYEK